MKMVLQLSNFSTVNKYPKNSPKLQNVVEGQTANVELLLATNPCGSQSNISLCHLLLQIT
jgi:hypothetical protein